MSMLTVWGLPFDLSAAAYQIRSLLVNPSAIVLLLEPANVWISSMNVLLDDLEE